jgi:SSS family solute:Na+ symporter
MINKYDYINIAFYFLFIAGVGIYFMWRSKNTSDYFRAGGLLPWWVTGASTWMASFSAWTFTGAAAKMYQTGPYAFGLYYAVLIPWAVLLFFTCYRFRRMQVVTPLEAVRLRFGQNSQVFFTWSRLPFMLIFGGISLNAIGVFMAAVFKVEVFWVIVAMGGMVTFLALLGGSFGVAASDFVQMFLIVAVTVTVSILALASPDIGGISGMLRQAPEAHYDWSSVARPEFILLWFVALNVTKLFEENAIDKSAKYLMARDDRHARMTLIIPVLGAILGPLLWLVPPTVAAIRHPDMATNFPLLKVPQEAAFLQTAADVLPQGMLGLLICGIFAATLTSMDAGLNQGAGIFVRNFYLPIFNPQCPERKLLFISKLATGVCGLVMIGFGLMWDHFRQSNLFDLVNQVAISLGIPISIPLFLGLFYRRTPPWAAWSTVIVGLVASISLNTLLKDAAGKTSIDRFMWVPGLNGPFTPEENTQFALFATVFVVAAVCMGWFFFTTIFYARSSEEYKRNVDEFFTRLKTPVLSRKGEEAREDKAVSESIGKLLLLYGGFVMLLVMIPNPATGRLCFLACGGVMVAAGALIWWNHRHSEPPLLSGAEKEESKSK